MKYLPLVWAGLTRKKARALLTFLAVTAAFILFGMSIGFNASIKHLVDIAHEDRIGVSSRFGALMPLGMANQLLRIPGVTRVAPQGAVCGYYQQPRNNTCVIIVDSNYSKMYPEVPLTPAQWHELTIHPDGAFYSRTLAQRWRLKVGDRFPIKAPGQQRADGNQTWTFQVLGIVDDMPDMFGPNGYALGDLNFFNKSRILANQNKIGFFHVQVDSPAHGEALAKEIDQSMASSGSPTWSMTDKFAYQNGASASGIDIDFLTESVAGAGLFMILFLTANAIAQSVRERIPEFAVLKTIGFSDSGVMALVFAETMLPCLLGAAFGMAIARWIVSIIPRLLPPGFGIPIPYLTPTVFALAIAAALIVAGLSAALPALRLKRLDVATALSGRG
jgi:putative ABC transport system permease protein